MTGPKADAKAIFIEALDCINADDLERYLDKACKNDTVLRLRVDELIRAHREAGAFLGGDSKQDVTTEQPIVKAIGSSIGPYKLLQQIGEGGMGTVYMAEQTHPIYRMVALKVIKVGMDTSQVIARFEAERQALAMMDHVNIARVIDGGATDSGRPYFVMELIHGMPITRYCDDNHLSLRERLELFIPVCQAIQHAHQKGIIHRDIKPSNVMITLYDGKPVPKVIDFGVAKATEQNLTERTLFTQYGTMVGTLEYMSPEQAEMNALGVDTRSDIYSLGVLLYELLTGSTPLDGKRVRREAYAEILRIIKEEDPPRPSTRLSDSDAALATISAQRHTEPAKLMKLVRGELDWIVMKCLEKDRSRRYETANALALDMQYFLNDETVQACPPSKWYHLRKFTRRNKPALTASMVIAVAVLLGTGISIWQAVSAMQAREEAMEKRDAAMTAEKAAKESEADTEAFGQFLVEDLLAVARPKGQKGGLGITVTVRQALDAAAPKISERFSRRPRAEAKARSALGLTYVYVGDAGPAIEQLERSVMLFRQQLGTNHIDTLDAILNLSIAYQLAERLDKAMPLQEESLKLQTILLGPDHPRTLDTMSNLALTYRDLGRLKEALVLFEETFKVQKARLGHDAENTLSTMNNLAGAYKLVGRFDESLSLYEEAVRLHKAKLGPEHPHTLASMGNLASAYKFTGRAHQAVVVFEDSLKIMKTNLGPDHPYTLGTMGNLGVTYRDAGRLHDALQLLEETLRLQQAKLGNDHSYTVNTMSNLAAVNQDAGRLVEAVTMFENTLKIQKAKLDLNHPAVLATKSNLAWAYLTIGRLNEALSLFEETRSLQNDKLGKDHPNTLASMRNLAWTYFIAGRLPEALSLFDETLTLQKNKLGTDHPNTLSSMNMLAQVYYSTGKVNESLLLLEETIKLRKVKLGAEHAETLGSMADLGLLMLKEKKFIEAEPLVRGILEIRQKKQPDRWTTFNTKSLLGGSLLGQKKYADAEPLLLAGHQGLKQLETRISWHDRSCLTESLERLVQLYDAWGRKNQSEEWSKKLEAHRLAERKPAISKEK